MFIDCFNVMGQTPLFVAAYTRKRRVTTTLLSLGADPNVRCLGGQTAVHAACHSGSVSLLATLLKYGGDLYIHDVHRQIPTDWVTDQADEKRRIRILDFLESVRRCTMRKPHTTTSGGGPGDFLQVWQLTHFFLFPFGSKSLICLEGKSMTPCCTLFSYVPPSTSLVSISDP